MPDRRRAQWLWTGLATLLACIVLLPLLGHKPLTDWDEGIYAEVSREMLTSGWLTPHWNGMPWFEKPPLMLWITALFFKFFGVSAFWARAASAFSGITLVALLHGWLRLRKNAFTAWLGTIFLLATPGFLHICHSGEMDAMLSLGCVFALIGLAEVDTGNSPGWYAFWAGFAFALMTKGAASVVIPLTCILLAASGGWKRGRLARDFWVGAVIFIALTLPWHLTMWFRFHQQFTDEYLGFHVLVRATRQIEGHLTPWWYFGTVLIAYACPFILIFPLTARLAWRDKLLRVWLLFPLVVVTFFSLIQTRLPHYIAPVYPALALLAASLAASLWQARSKMPWTPRRVVTGAGLAIAGLLSVLLTSGLRGGLHRAQPDGPAEVRDRRESIDMAQLAATQPVAGLLLVWRGGAPASIAAEVFYSRRPVEQVQLGPIIPGPPLNRYAESRIALDDALTNNPELLLLDNQLLDHVPNDLRFAPIRHGRTVTLGMISRAP